MLDCLEIVFSTYGYIAVFLVLILCGMGLPIPEDISLISGGVIAGLGRADLYIMIAVAMIGVLMGDGIMFAMGRVFGDKILNIRWMSRLLTAQRHKQVQKKFAQYGDRVIFIGRFLPLIRAPIYVIAGMSRQISYFKFFLMDGFAALISVPLWVWLGYYCAENRELITKILSNTKIAISILIVLCLILGIIWYKKRQNKT